MKFLFTSHTFNGIEKKSSRKVIDILVRGFLFFIVMSYTYPELLVFLSFSTDQRVDNCNVY